MERFSAVQIHTRVVLMLGVSAGHVDKAFLPHAKALLPTCRAAGDALAQRLDKRQLRYDLHRTMVTAAYGAFAVGEWESCWWNGGLLVIPLIYPASTVPELSCTAARCT